VRWGEKMLLMSSKAAWNKGKISWEACCSALRAKYSFVSLQCPFLRDECSLFFWESEAIFLNIFYSAK